MRRAGTSGKTMRLHAQGCGLDLLCTDTVRPTLFSLFLANAIAVEESDLTACDLGAGGGVQAIVLALLGVERVVAIDRSEVACEVAAENVRRNGVASRVEVVQGDLATLGDGREFDLLVSNPPTMPGRPGAPGFTAGGGASGLDFVRLIAAGMDGWLAPGGRAQLALSSLVEPEALEILGEAGFLGRPLATLLAPFRPFYMTSFEPDRLDRFVAEGRALREADGTLSELIAVHAFSRA